MLRANPDALVCDLAETYGIRDHRTLPARTLGVLAAGLSEESRSKRFLSGRKATRMECLLAAAVDGINRITWLLSAVCPHEGDGPRSVLRAILGEAEKKKVDEATVFESPEAFETEWERIAGVGHGQR